MSEPRITINGTELTEAQTMAVRVSCGKHAEQLLMNAIGEDDPAHGSRAFYLERLAEIDRLMKARSQDDDAIVEDDGD